MNRSDVRKALTRLVTTWAALCAACGASVARADVSSDVEKAHSAYVAHKYEDAEKRLRALLDAHAGPLDNPDAVADARMYLGAVLVAEGKKDQAAEVFEELLLDRPDYQPDPLRVSLQAIDALIDARTRLRDRLEAITAERVRKAQEEKARVEAEKHREATRLALLEKWASEEVFIERNSRWKALVPFGAGQFQNRQPTLGWSLVVTEAMWVAGSAVGAALTLYNVDQANAANTRRDATAAQAYQGRAHDAAIWGDSFAAAFAVTALVGIVHAEVTFVPQRVEVHKRAIPEVTWGPFLGPGALGVVGTY
ncbi:MAG: hypothetical protein ABSF69_04650 [Polyangiaceae bacterium]|jgi:tetratricopeptide (TPR) repeat protein